MNQRSVLRTRARTVWMIFNQTGTWLQPKQGQRESEKLPARWFESTKGWWKPELLPDFCTPPWLWKQTFRVGGGGTEGVPRKGCNWWKSYPLLIFNVGPTWDLENKQSDFANGDNLLSLLSQFCFSSTEKRKKICIKFSSKNGFWKICSTSIIL